MDDAIYPIAPLGYRLFCGRLALLSERIAVEVHGVDIRQNIGPLPATTKCDVRARMTPS